MNNSREKFYKAMHKKYAWNNCEDILANHDSYSERVFLCVYYSWEAWQAATEQSQKEIEALQAREKELVEALRYVNKELIMYGYQYESKDSINVVLNEALANVRGEL